MYQKYWSFGAGDWFILPDKYNYYGSAASFILSHSLVSTVYYIYLLLSNALK